MSDLKNSAPTYTCRTLHLRALASEVASDMKSSPP